MNNGAVLTVKDLQVYYDTPAGTVKAVDGISFDLRPGERLGLVGESGSGKSTMALALMRLHKPPARIAGGEVLLDGIGDVMKLDADALRRIRLDRLALVPQGAMNSLNPVMRIRDQLADGIKTHEPGDTREDLAARIQAQLARVGLDAEVGGKFPHELSGGMKQRVAIAIGTSLSPSVIIADEPTSALDVVVQRQVMETLRSVQEEIGASVLIVGHDMGLMAQIARPHGRDVCRQTCGTGARARPVHQPATSLHEAVDRERADPYGQARAGKHSRFTPTLINVPPAARSIPAVPARSNRVTHRYPSPPLRTAAWWPVTCIPEKPHEGLSGDGQRQQGLLGRDHSAPPHGGRGRRDDDDRRADTVHSGRGRGERQRQDHAGAPATGRDSTIIRRSDLPRAVVGQPLARAAADLPAGDPAIFQDPFESYNPFYKVDHVLTVPAKKFQLSASREETTRLIEESLDMVGLQPAETLGRFPHQLSGGQRQRVMVARAMLLRPRLIVADEPVSMVDASLRATILESIRRMKLELGISVVYITHDLTTAYQIADNILVMYKGSVVEAGSVEQVIRDPKHPYTQLLVSSIPQPDPSIPWGAEAEIAGDPESMEVADTGCKFVDRCPVAFDPCRGQRPPLYHQHPSRAAACFRYNDAPVLEGENLDVVFEPQLTSQASSSSEE